MLKIILKKEENLISSHNVHIGVGTTRIISKCTTMQALEVRKFKQNAQKFLIHQVEKSKEQSLLCYKYTYYTVVNMSAFLTNFSLVILLNCLYYSVSKFGSLHYVQIVLKLHTNYYG